MRHVGCASSSSSLILLLLLLLLFPLLLAVRWILNFRHHKMRQLGIIPLGRILIIEAKAEQIHTNTFFVLQLQNVRQNVVCGRGFLWLVNRSRRYWFHLPSSNGVIPVAMKTWRIAFFVFSSCNSSMWVF
jgi:hypothetical protein